MGVCVNVGMAFFISRFTVRRLAVVSAIVTMITPPLMATIPVGQNYWFAPFWALFLSPANADGKFGRFVFIFTSVQANSSVLFTVSNLVISDAFPAETQSLAGAVFNVVAQLGNSVGLAVTAAIAASVTEHSDIKDHGLALMEGFRAAFWTLFAATAAVVVVCFFGLQRGGVVGKKTD